MSGSTIGSFVGAGLGFLIGGPAGARIGWMAGGLIGGLIAPEKIKGPRLTDARSQTAQDGTPRTYGNGTFPTTGVLLWRDPTINEVETEEGGKGGPKQITYTYTRSYAIGVCRGPIAGYLIIKRNGKIVYDTRTNAELVALGYTSAQIAETRAAQAKWQEVATLYYGGDDQLPDPTIQAVKGAGNVPAYRGSAYIVCTDDDVTDLQGAVPQYEFVVSVCGTRTEELPPEEWRWLATGQTGAGTRASVRPLTEAMAWYGSSDIETIPTNTTSSRSIKRLGDYMVSNLAGSQCRIALVSDIETWTAGPTMGSSIDAGGNSCVVGGRLYVACRDSGLAYIDSALDSAFSFDTGMLPLIAAFKTGVNGVTGNGSNLLCNDSHGVFYHKTGGGSWATGVDTGLSGTSKGALDSNGDRAVLGGLNGTTLAAHYTDDNGVSSTAASMPALANISPSQTKHIGNGVWLMACVNTAGSPAVDGTLFKSTDNGETFSAVTLPIGLEFQSQYQQNIAVDAVTGRVVIVGQDAANAWHYYYSDDLTIWTEIPRTGTAVTGITEIYPPGSYTAPIGTELPDAPGHYVDDDGVVNGPAGTTVERCLVTLGDIVEEQCAVRGVTSVDVSELTDEVDGFRVASETSPQRNIQALQVGYFFDGSEYDGVLHFPKRGAAATFALTEEDFVSRDGDPIEWEVTKENELLRKVTVGYIDPATTYTQTTQNWERRAGTIAAQGEGTIDLSVTGNKDWAKQAAEKHVKAAWAETKECKFSVSVAHAALVTGQVGTIPSSEGGTHLIRITRIEDDGDVRHITAKKTQPNAYGSTATGVIINPPRFPGSPLSGPTVSVVMNLPVLRDEDDKAGVYWAATGLLTNWPGAVLTLSRNGTTFENGPQMTVPCTIGVLTAALPTASRYTLDTANTLSVRLYPGASDLANASYDDLIETEANSAAILYSDGTAEILQFTTRTVTGTREYDLTGLLRGRLDTAIATHADGALFVLLDNNVRFAAIKASDVGKTLTFRGVSFGTVADSNPSQTVTMTTIESLREWSPYNVTVTTDGVGGYCVEWIGRARLGTSRTPVHSQWFDGYRVTFSRLGAEHIIDTTEQSACATADDLSAFTGTPYVTVVARSRVATNDDDFASPPASDPSYPDGGGAPNTGDPMTDPGHSATRQLQGTPPDGYVGVPYRLKGDGSDYYVNKGSTTAAITVGGFTANVTACNRTTSGTGENGVSIRGIPLTAHTANADARFVSDLAALAGNDAITDSITYAAKPTYSLPNWMARADFWDVGLVDTTPPWTTAIVHGGGALESWAEVTTGKVRAEFTVAGLTDTARTMIGVVVADANEPDAQGEVTASRMWSVPANGTYAVELDADTGAIQILDGAASVVHATTLARGSRVYRFRWSGQERNVTVKSNYGNEAWVITPTAGFGGMPLASVVVPVQWDGRTNQTYQVSSNGKYGPACDAGYILTAGGVGLLLGSFGHSAGQKRVRLHDQTTVEKQRVGLCLASHTGQLGQGGASIGYRNSNREDRFHRLYWTWGGTSDYLPLPAGFDTSNEGFVHSRPSDVVFAPDFAAGTVEVWIAEADSAGVMRPLRLWTTISGMPAGTYFPALYADNSGTASLYHSADEPSGYSDWTETIP